MVMACVMVRTDNIKEGMACIMMMSVVYMYYTYFRSDLPSLSRVGLCCSHANRRNIFPQASNDISLFACPSSSVCLGTGETEWQGETHCQESCAEEH